MLFRKFKSALSGYFTFTTRERRGTMWLLLIVCLQLCWIWYDRHFLPPASIDLSDFGAIRLQADTTGISEQATRFSGDSGELLTVKKKDTLFFFDPNTISAEQWMLLGLSEKQAQSIQNYRNKGGRFRRKEDLARMYAISKPLYSQLEPFIRFHDSVPQPFENKTLQFSERKEVQIELNTSTAEDLDRLPMIGNSRAERIIKYRDALGGFLNKEQLKEVYGIDSLTYAAIENRITVRPELIIMSNINDDSLRHPYLPYKVLKLIRAYRKEHGDFTDPQDIQKITLINEEIYRKIAPYLTAE